MFEVWIGFTNINVDTVNLSNNKHDKPSIINKMKAKTLSWAGHVQRLPSDQLTKQVCEENQSGKIP